MSAVSRKLQAKVVRRAGNRCEYCGLSQVGQEATFHVDHVVPQAAGGGTDEGNLALACVSCSLRKWAHQSGVDPESGNTVALFNPRSQDWHDHFRWEGPKIVPLTAIGRCTVSSLAMNRPFVVAIRKEEMLRKRHPPG